MFRTDEQTDRFLGSIEKIAEAQEKVAETFQRAEELEISGAVTRVVHGNTVLHEGDPIEVEGSGVTVPGSATTGSLGEIGVSVPIIPKPPDFLIAAVKQFVAWLRTLHDKHAIEEVGSFINLINAIDRAEEMEAVDCNLILAQRNAARAEAGEFRKERDTLLDERRDRRTKYENLAEQLFESKAKHEKALEVKDRLRLDLAEAREEIRSLKAAPAAPAPGDTIRFEGAEVDRDKAPKRVWVPVDALQEKGKELVRALDAAEQLRGERDEARKERDRAKAALLSAVSRKNIEIEKLIRERDEAQADISRKEIIKKGLRSDIKVYKAKISRLERKQDRELKEQIDALTESMKNMLDLVHWVGESKGLRVDHSLENQAKQAVKEADEALARVDVQYKGMSSDRG